jgi:zinc protease
MEGSTLEVRQTERSGVPVLWGESPGSCIGALLVRSGKADETLRISGINHMVEHLALFPLGRPAYGYNGRVEDAVTLFFAEGTPEEVAGFLREVAGNLAALPVDRLDVERRILMTEASGRDVGVESRMLAHRFGPCGYGMYMQEELGLGWLDGAQIQQWATDHFTTGNAVAWMSAAPPEDLELPLPAGAAVRPPPPAPIPRLELPAEIVAGTGGVALTTLAPRSSALSVGFGIAAERAHERLRRDAGISYSATASYLPLDSATVHVMLHADCKDHNAAQVRDGLVTVLEDLAEHGPSAEELERDLELTRRARAEPNAVLGLLDYSARELLYGRELPSAEELDRERRELTASDIAAAVAEAMDRLLVLVPNGTDRDTKRFTEFKASRTPPVEGAVYGPTDLRRSLGDTEILIVSAEGVTATDEAGSDSLTVRFTDCVGFIPLVSGAATVVDRSGAWLVLNPRLYRRGHEALARVREAVSERVVVPFTDRERELAPIVEEQLGDDVARIPSEVDALASVVTPDEQVTLLTGAAWDGQYGLVVVTDRRLLFYAMAGDKLVEYPRASARAEVKGRFRRKRLEVAADGARHELTLINPPAQLDRLALELR